MRVYKTIMNYIRYWKMFFWSIAITLSVFAFVIPRVVTRITEGAINTWINVKLQLTEI